MDIFRGQPLKYQKLTLLVTVLTNFSLSIKFLENAYLMSEYKIYDWQPVFLIGDVPNRVILYQLDHFA